MLNMLDTQDKLKNFSEGQLIQAMQMPSGSAPQFMVLGEIDRRKRMRADAQKQEGLMQPTVAQEAVNGAGVPQQGLAGIAQSLAPQTSMAQNTGVGSVQEPVRMAGGGVIRLAEAGRVSAGTMSAIAQLKVAQPELYAQVKDDPEELKLAAEYFVNVAQDAETTTLEGMAAPRENDLLKRMFRDPTQGMIKDQQKLDDAEFGSGYALDQRSESLSNSRGLPADSGIFSEGAPVESVRGTSGPTPGGIIGGSMFAMPSLPETDDTTRPYFPIKPAFDGVQLPSMLNQVKTPSGSDSPLSAPSMETAPDASGLTDEQARRLYLSGRDYKEGDVPAIVDMLNRGREFQQSDTTVPREQIYDLGERGRLKYQEASDAETLSMSDRLAREQLEQENRMSKTSLAELTTRRDAQRIGDRVFDRKIGGDQLLSPEDRRNASIGRLVDQSVDAVDDIKNRMSRPGVKPDEAASEGTPAAVVAAEAERIAALVGGNTNTGGGGGTGSGSDKKSGIVAAKNEMDQDKWLALAQAGLTLMSTGDFGKAGIAGLGALRQTKADDMAERKLDAELMLRETQMAAANRQGRGGGGGGLTIDKMLARGNALIKTGQNMLENAGDNADLAAEANAMILAGTNLVRQALGNTAPAGPTVTKAPSAT